MSDRGLAQLLQLLRRRAAPKSDLVPDGELLGRYLTTRDEAAFELLVRRHGPMVLGVAQRVLRNSHAAEDAFQAVFLTLARKAKSLRRHDSLASWLYRVAFRIAVRAKANKFQQRQIRGAEAPEPIATTDATPEWVELRHVLDEEISQLPDRFRSAIVLCYFSGKTTEEAAQLLGCPRGTVLSRLAAGRERLREGLTRRGYAVSVATLTAGLASESTAVGGSAALVALAMNVIGPTATVAPAVASLSYGVLHAMFMTKMKVAAGLLLMVGGLGFGISQLGAGDDDPKAKPNRPVAKKPTDDPEAKQRADAERREIEAAIMASEEKMYALLKSASQQRVKLKSRILELEDQIEELRQAMGPALKTLDQYLALRVGCHLKFSEWRRDEAVTDDVIKRQGETLDYLDRMINDLQKQLQTQRAQIRVLRRNLLEAEEELKLQETLSTMQMERLRRIGR
jgi:RNA polymerase sigma factor (sigma-70 family)